MIKLFVEDSNLHSPVAAVRWCIDKNTMNKLREREIIKPYMALFVARENDEEFRQVDQKVVPLDQAMEYIEFHSPGKHIIFGCLVWINCVNQKEAKKDLISYFKDHWCVSSKGEFIKPTSYSDDEIDSGSVNVVVPDGYFAKEPVAWERWWVNLWYESKPVNQCHFRRRKLLAYSIQPLMVLGYVLCRTFLSLIQILVLLLIGTRKIQYQVILHPFIYDRWDAAPDKLSSVFLENSSGVKRDPVYLLSVPLVQLVILGLLWFVNWGLHKLGLSFGSVLLWLLAINVVMILAAIIVSILGGWNKLFPTETKEQKEARIKLELERLYDEYQDMVCVGAPLRPSVSSLPSKRRTFYLRIQEFKFKSKVCLPFAR